MAEAFAQGAQVIAAWALLGAGLTAVYWKRL